MKKSIYSAIIACFAIGAFAFFKQAYASETSAYTVQIGDSLSSIAQSQLGSIDKWQDIYNANKDQISDPNIIEPGEILIIPDQAPVTPIHIDVQPIKNSTANPAVITQDVTVAQVPIYQPVYTYTAPPVLQNPSGSYADNRAKYQSIIQSAAAQYGVSADVMNSIISCESGYNPNAYNASSGATGIAQFMPGTYAGSWNIYNKQYGLTSPEGQIYAMALKIAEGDVRAWACYKG